MMEKAFAVTAFVGGIIMVLFAGVHISAVGLECGESYAPYRLMVVGGAVVGMVLMSLRLGLKLWNHPLTRGF